MNGTTANDGAIDGRMCHAFVLITPCACLILLYIKTNGDRWYLIPEKGGEYYGK